MASFEYISFLVIATLPSDNLKLIITVSAGIFLIPLSTIAASEILSFVFEIYFPELVKSAIEIQLLSVFFQ